MPEYLSKEEIRQWRSSLERITLEEFAARLGKTIQGEKQTNDMVDKVMSRSLNSMPVDTDYPRVKAEKIQTIAIKSFEKEKEISKLNKEEKTKQNMHREKTPLKPIQEKKPELKREVLPEIITSKNDAFYSFKKNLTAREQMIFDHFLANKNSIVYAKDLAKILDLPRDYVYKYIKNLRSKLNEDVLYNADNGGYVLKF
ncbi:MAG: helix-turn-helix domain-containing protein [Candidatus Gastranaerophilales bacterium]|nr:helix-turn-helix domain-containing protein [Candidatus Gastranaerophilales bacterium]